MNVDTIEVALRDRAYPVLVGDGWLDSLTERVPLPGEARRALLITQDPVVAAGHVTVVETALRAAGIEVTRQLVPTGEAAKDVAVLADLWGVCADIALRRTDLVVAVGGGAVGDLAGFVAATYNRGVAVLQIPTTLLAQVDAAIGGKTGINLPAGKNLVGAFHQPFAVACDVATLQTLPPRILREGLGEVVKYGLSHDPILLTLLESAPSEILRGEVTLLEELVGRSARVKARVVAADEHEAGERAFLNLGHTYGHAVEALTGYEQVLHGEAVSIGLVVALRLGVVLGRTPPGLVGRTERLLTDLGLPIRPPALPTDEAWQIMARDKKAGADGVRFVVLDDLASPVVVTPDRAQVDAVLAEWATP